MKTFTAYLQEGFSHYISHKVGTNVLHPAVIRTKTGDKEEAVKKYIAREKIKKHQIVAHDVERIHQDVD